MTDKRIRMECPFCHTKAEEIQLITNYGYAEIRCPNNKCAVKITSTSKQDVIDRWNRR